MSSEQEEDAGPPWEDDERSWVEDHLREHGWKESDPTEDLRRFVQGRFEELLDQVKEKDREINRMIRALADEVNRQLEEIAGRNIAEVGKVADKVDALLAQTRADVAQTLQGVMPAVEALMAAAESHESRLQSLEGAVAWLATTLPYTAKGRTP